MDRIALIIGPIFGMAVLGFVSGKIRLLDEQAARGLSSFVFKLALPILLFRLMAKLTLHEFQIQGMLAYYTGAFLIYAGAALFHERFFGLKVEEAGSLAMGAAFSNNVLLGLPIVMKIYGDKGVTPLLLIISCHTAVLFGMGTLWIEARRTRAQPGGIFKQVFHDLSRNPIVLGLISGALYNLSSLPFPPLLEEMTGMFVQAGVPCALFSMGLSLCQFQFKGNRRHALTTVFMKLVLFPILMYVLAKWVFRLEPTWVTTTVLAASLPSGINAYLFAQSYQSKEATLAATVLAATGLSMFTVTFVLWLHL